MSFAYLPLFTGDYLRDTQHLSMSEHGAYLKLLMHCWDQKGPAPLDERKLMGIVNARSTDEIESLRRVLAEFFVRMDDGFYNPRMQREIEKTENISGIRALAGRKGYEARAKHLLSKSQASAKSAQRVSSQASAKQVHLSPSPSPSPSPSLSLSLSPTPKTKTRARTTAVDRPDGVSEQVWDDFLAHRRARRAPLTQTALAQLAREATKAKVPIEKALEICCLRGWTGFRADWLAQARGADVDLDRLVREIEQERS